MKRDFSFRITEDNALQRYSVIAIIIGILNLAWLHNRTMSSLLVTAELSILILLIITRQFSSFFSFLIIITALSFNSSTFAGADEFYGWNTIKLYSIEIVAWVLFLFIIISLVMKKPKRQVASHEFMSFLKVFILLCILGVIIGLITIMCNDNNITNVEKYEIQYIAVGYIMAFFPLEIIYSTYYCWSREPESFYRIRISVISIFIGCSAQAFYSLITKSIINYGGVEGIGLAISNIYFYLPFAICYFLYSKKEPKLTQFTYLSMIIIGIIIVVLNNANGKFLLFLLMIPLIACGLFKVRSQIAIPIILLFGIVGVVIVLLNSDITNNYLLSKKIDEVKGILNIFSSDWLKKMPASPQFRITEFLNICIEYINKPWYLVTGKGYLGSIKDHIGMFNRVGGDFSDYQWNNGTFYFLHESINLLFLNNGLLGLLIWGNILKFTLKNYQKSFYILLGGIWFCLNYGYSIIITIVGMVSLVIGLLEIKQLESNSNTVRKGNRI